jgi:DNA-binding response OmpR family regulator
MPRILLIDDDATLRKVMAMAMTLHGHVVVQAGDGREGVKLARSEPFDVVITDLIMPGQEGIETIGILRREFPPLPIIAISGGLPNSKLYLDIAHKIGAQRVLAKPFAMADLQSAICAVFPATPPPAAAGNA